jgi:hypothetical protein
MAFYDLSAGFDDRGERVEKVRERALRDLQREIAVEPRLRKLGRQQGALFRGDVESALILLEGGIDAQRCVITVLGPSPIPKISMAIQNRRWAIDRSLRGFPLVGTGKGKSMKLASR